MNWLETIKRGFLNVATTPLMTSERLYWVYLLTAILIACLLYLIRSKSKSSISGLLSFLFPKAIYTHPSAWVDFKFMLVNKLIKFACLAPIVLLFPWVSSKTSNLLTTLIGSPNATAPPTTPILVIYTILATICFDLSLYISHLLQHKVKFLWEFHKVHHSAQVLYPVTVHRVHPVDDILATTLMVGSTGILSGVFHHWFPAGIQVVSYWQLNIVVLVFYILGYNLRHSHIWLSYGRYLSHLVMSPAQHQIHHSKNPRHFDKNMGYMLSLWDWIFGTLHVPKEEEQNELEFGLGNAEDEEFRSVWTLYSRPFRMLFRSSEQKK